MHGPASHHAEICAFEGTLWHGVAVKFHLRSPDFSPCPCLEHNAHHGVAVMIGRSIGTKLKCANSSTRLVPLHGLLRRLAIVELPRYVMLPRARADKGSGLRERVASEELSFLVWS